MGIGAVAGVRALDALVDIHRRLARQGIDLAVRAWDGTELGPDGAGYRLVLRHPWSLRAAFVPPNDLTAGEAYLRDDIDVEGSMVAALRAASRVRAALRPGGLPWLLRDLIATPRPPRRSEVAHAHLTGRRHSKRRDAQAVRSHYDAGNDFYRLFLDDALVYSCAYFTDDDDDDLHRAQSRKLALICRKLRLSPGERFLDIGCGWGSLVIHAARHHGVHALGVTLSEPQAELARERAAAAGVADRVRIEVADYRDVDGAFDAVASVGMFEHVGPDHLRGYFERCFRLVGPGGRFLNHGITTGRRDVARDLGRLRRSFAGRYVFPDGGLVPARVAVRMVEQVGFELLHVEQLRPHYALTLRAWVQRLEGRAVEARALAGERTFRTWRAYMAGSALGFESGDLGVVQVLGGRDARLPLSHLSLV